MISAQLNTAPDANSAKRVSNKAILYQFRRTGDSPPYPFNIGEKVGRTVPVLHLMSEFRLFRHFISSIATGELIRCSANSEDEFQAKPTYR